MSQPPDETVVEAPPEAAPDEPVLEHAGVSKRQQRVREALLAYAFLAPAAIVFGVFIFYPFFKNFDLVLYRANPNFPERTTYRGLEEPKRILFDDVIWSDGPWGLLAVSALVLLVAALGRRLVQRPSRRSQPWPVTRYVLVAALVLGVTGLAVSLNRLRHLMVDNEVWDSLWITVIFTLMTVPAGIFLGLALAVAAHQRLRGIAIYRTVFASTVTTSVAVAAVVFGTLFNPQIGWLPYLGIDLARPLTDDPTWALPLVAFVTVWQNMGFAFIIMSAGLQAVPDDVLEAAQVDGARAWRRFWRITVPLLSPTIYFSVVVGTIMAFQAFGQVDILTRGGPGRDTQVLAYAIYDSSLRGTEPDPSRAAVLSILLFLVTLVVTIFQTRILEKRVHYA